jgi:hypothetical protein
MKRTTSIFLAALWCYASAHAGPPFLTDDPEPVERHHTEFNVALQDTRTSEGHSGTAGIDVNYGCAAEIQCHFALPAAFNKSPGTGMQTGIGDVEFGVKYRFLNRADSGLMAAVYPTVFLPTGNSERGLGNGTAQLLLPVLVQTSSGPWTWDANVSYLFNRAPGARSSWFTSVLALRSFGEGLKAGAELFHRTSVATDAPPTTGFNVGVVLKLSESRNLLASLGRGLQGVAANRRSVYLAYQIEL